MHPRALGMGVVTLLIIVSVSLADDKKGKPKNDDGPTATTVDLSKLPPDVVEKILDLVKEAEKSEKKPKKGPDGEKPAPPRTKRTTIDLPPTAGARDSINHEDCHHG